MNCDLAIERIADRVARRVPDDDMIELDHHLRGCESCRSEAASIALMLDPLDFDVPSERLRVSFDAWLWSQQKHRSKLRIRRWLIAAAVAAGLALVIVVPLRRQLASAGPADFEQVERIEPDRVRQIARLESASDRRSMEQLLATLKGDPNPAVRLAALDSLVQASSVDQLRPRLSSALLTEESPFVRDAITSVIEEVK